MGPLPDRAKFRDVGRENYLRRLAFEVDDVRGDANEYVASGFRPVAPHGAVLRPVFHATGRTLEARHVLRVQQRANVPAHQLVFRVAVVAHGSRVHIQNRECSERVNADGQGTELKDRLVFGL